MILHSLNRQPFMYAIAIVATIASSGFACAEQGSNHSSSRATCDVEKSKPAKGSCRTTSCGE